MIDRKKLEEALAMFQVPCDCPKGGYISEEPLQVCRKCDGSEWVFPVNSEIAFEALEALEKLALIDELDEVSFRLTEGPTKRYIQDRITELKAKKG